MRSRLSVLGVSRTEGAGLGLEELGGVLARVLAVGGNAGERLPDGELVHLTGALVRRHRLEIAGVPQHRDRSVEL